MSDNLGERMATIEANQKNVEKKVDEGFTAVHKKLDDFIEKADEKYAPKWVADALKWVAIIIIGAVIVTVLSLIGLKASL